ncbi:hypothetical protein [Brevibacterium yomogidense]|uniref:hypothetical protein n=1 Tax=Brevibacterium yomogidense TaxID=946573 RepID=UPI001177B60A|nr:hypothetical protein [Brevibacterium yomogidense]
MKALNDVGSLAEWVGSIGGILAVIAAFVAWRVSSRLLTVEQKRDEDRKKADDDRKKAIEREQAELVFVLGARLTQRGKEEEWAIFLYNGSTKPIYNVKVDSQRLNGSSENPSLELGALPPGRFVVPSHPEYGWGALIDLDRSNEAADFLVKGKGQTMITEVAFADSAGKKWCLSGGTKLEEKNTSPQG